MKLFLIGYMGSGKSTAGKKLAAKLGLGFLDLDEYIEKEYGKTIAEIFETEGEERFRELEHLYLKKVMEMDNIVLSLGGGTPCFYNHMEMINNNGISIYFKMSADALANRLMNAKKERPLIKNMSASELKEFITSSLEKRETFYLQAQYKVKAKDLNIDELVVFLRDKAGIGTLAGEP